MNSDVFISYSNKDKNAADAVCSIMEQNGIRCWIAPRDITPGTPFAEGIIDGIKGSRVFILIYSSNSNSSSQVIKEVDRAVHHRLAIIPLRLEDVPMTKQLEYYVSDVHWMDALTPPLEKHINDLCSAVRILLAHDEIDKDDIKRALKTENAETRKPRRKSKGFLRKRILIPAFIILAVLVIGSFLIFKKQSDPRISITVMPFRNMTGDTTWNIWQEVIQNNLMTFLVNTKELLVKSSVNDLIYASKITNFAALTRSDEKKIARKLDADYFISGEIFRTAAKLRITAKIFETDRSEAVKSFEAEGLANEEMIFHVADSLKKSINDYLIVTGMKKNDMANETVFMDPTSSPQAFKCMISGQRAFGTDPTTAIEQYKKAISLDSNLYDAYWQISICYIRGLQDWKNGKKWMKIYYSKFDLMDLYNQTFANYICASWLKTPQVAISYINKMIDMGSGAPYNFVNLGTEYARLFQYDQTVKEDEKALEIYERWGLKPDPELYIILGPAYHSTGQFRKEKRLYKKAESDYPEIADISACQAILAISRKDTISGNRYLQKFKSLLRANSWSEARISNQLGKIYDGAGDPEKAEKYFREAVKGDPGNTRFVNNLGFFLIDKDRNVDEGLDLIESALKLAPDNYLLLDSKGWGYYKKGNFSEAQNLLQRSWDLRLENARYDHAAFLHLEAAKNAAAGQKNSAYAN